VNRKRRAPSSGHRQDGCTCRELEVVSATGSKDATFSLVFELHDPGCPLARPGYTKPDYPTKDDK
jgi:hypothetical protein